MKICKICEICGINPATVPDRNRMGRPVKRICSSCHRDRLKGDMERILKNYREADAARAAAMDAIKQAEEE